jgi:3-isopropylmalate/(R)-2-methylmalate dehydratase large subunit
MPQTRGPRFPDEVRRANEYRELAPDKDASYAKELHVDATKLEPLIAAPHRVDNVKPVSEFAGMELNQVCIGSCTNGRLEDIKIAADILKGAKVHRDTRLVVYAASRGILLEAMKAGYIQTLVEAGADMPAGLRLDRQDRRWATARDVLSTQNRNFKGRMGNNKAEIYLSNVPVAAVSGFMARSPT